MSDRIKAAVASVKEKILTSKAEVVEFLKDRSDWCKLLKGLYLVGGLIMVGGEEAIVRIEDESLYLDCLKDLGQ